MNVQAVMRHERISLRQLGTGSSRAEECSIALGMRVGQSSATVVAFWKRFSEEGRVMSQYFYAEYELYVWFIRRLNYVGQSEKIVSVVLSKE